MAVASHPLRGELPHFVGVTPIILGQPLVANRFVEALHVRVLQWLAWLDMFNANSLATGPVQQCSADIFRPVVTTNDCWLATTPDAVSFLKLVVHEIHRPDRITGLGHRERLWFLTQQPRAGPDAQIQLLLSVDAVNTLVIP